MLSFLLHSPLFKAASIYTFSRIINASIPFLLIPVFTRHLSPADYGVVAMFIALTGIVNPFVGLNLHGSIGLAYYDRDAVDMPRYVGTCLQIVAASTAVVFCALWLGRGLVSHLTTIPHNWVLVVIVVSAGQFIVQTKMILWQVRMQPVPYGIFQNLQTALNIGLATTFILALGMDWRGWVLAQVIAVSLFAIIGLALLARGQMLSFSFQRSAAKRALRFGLPLIPHELGSLLIVQTDRFLITNMVSIADAGIYSVGLQIVSVIELVAASFNQAFSPWLFRQLSSPDGMEKERIVRFTYVYFLLILSLSLALGLLMPVILQIFVGRNFQAAGEYTVWLALAFSFSGMYYMVANYIVFASRTALLALVTVCTAIVNICCTYVLIRQNGALGAAQATAIAFFLSFVLTWFLSARVYKMPWDPRKAFAGILRKRQGMDT